MKAILLNTPGGADQLFPKGIPAPQPQADEVLIQVHAISINPVDIKTRKGGSLYNTLKEQPPVILGWDVSGVITAVGRNVQRFKAGDAVFGMVNFPGQGRAYAEYVVAPESHIAYKPDSISHKDAAAACLAALTAWQALVYEAGLQQGQQVLVQAAAGGVGHFAVQMARHLGAEVTGTARAENFPFLKELGVQHCVDYREPNAYASLKDIDVVLDPIGGDTTLQSLQVLKPGGTLISIVGGVKEHLNPIIAQKHLHAKNYLVHSSGPDMEQIATLLGQGFLKPHIEHEYTFDQIAEAHHQIETGRTRGKVVLTLA